MQAYSDIYQGRTNYQLKHFVIGQHRKPQQQYIQILLEAKSLSSSITGNKLKLKKLNAEIEELKATGKKSDAVEAEIQELSKPEIENQIKSAERELSYLEELYDQFPEYSREEIEKAQAEYWEDRLIRVAQLQMLGNQTGVSWGQLDALHQADILEKAITKIPTMNYLSDREQTLEIDKEELENE